MEGKQSCTTTESPTGDDRNKDPGSGGTGGKSKKKKHKKRQSKEKTQTEQPNSSQSCSSKPNHSVTRTTCDQSTQTEAPQIVSTQTEATQTSPLQCIHTQPTESKSTQTARRSKPTFKQAYEFQVSTNESSEQARDPNQLTVLTWNIDGLDFVDIPERVPSLLSYLGKHHADVVLLQEIIPFYLNVLEDVMTDYEFLQGAEEDYFTAILLRKSRVELLQSNIVKYPTTEMGRNLLMAHASFLGHRFCFMTSQLESSKTNSQERMNQLRRVWKRMKEAPDDQTVIFGGDTNLRDREVRQLGGLPDGIMDVWEMLGQPEDCMYTWDTVTNNNVEIPFPAQLRFDRLYLRAAKEDAQLKPDTMRLVGLKRLKCGRFTSDHWGILCTFSFELSTE